MSGLELKERSLKSPISVCKTTENVYMYREDSQGTPSTPHPTLTQVLLKGVNDDVWGHHSQWERQCHDKNNTDKNTDKRGHKRKKTKEFYRWKTSGPVCWYLNRVVRHLNVPTTSNVYL